MIHAELDHVCCARVAVLALQARARHANSAGMHAGLEALYMGVRSDEWLPSTRHQHRNHGVKHQARCPKHHLARRAWRMLLPKMNEKERRPAERPVHVLRRLLGWKTASETNARTMSSVA